MAVRASSNQRHVGFLVLSDSRLQTIMSSNPLALFLSRSTASPYAILLSLGFGLISYSFWGSLAAQSIGAIAIPVNPNERRKLGLDTSKSVEVWNWAFGRGAVSSYCPTT
jgi:hypothetical protein